MRLQPSCLPRYLLVASVSLLSACDSPKFELLAPLPSGQLNALRIESPVQAVHFRDREGEGLLILSRGDDQVQDEQTSEDLDQVILTATLYGRPTERDTFKVRWKIENETDCAGLDLDVGFYTDVSGVTDLNNDGVAELTVASHAFCGGGIDPHELRVELREGQQSYAIVGQSLITPPGEAPYGGEREDSPSLQAAPVAIREHLDQVWNKILTRPWNEIAPMPEDSDEP
ncbi:M949_RS01915 family surface polysaccharide biosynthesis protein [Pseudomonas sp. NUPR-001]|uniref:M949_RS01915 family surface polysaccharide biosynthesis protein n=1 Tax=Pseudomonas sp. NUPR-001 TaxID=3416058 RepID=UPI003F95B0F1